jgi:HK97 family phage portal protein
MSFFLPAGERRNQAFKEPFWQGMAGLFSGGGRSRSGQSVTAKSALEVTTVLACVRVLAEGVSQVPLNVYRKRDGGGSDIATDHPLHRILHRRPNYWQTSFEMRENLMIQAALMGNFYAFKNRVRGQIAEIIPFRPGAVREDWTALNGIPKYWATGADGSEREFPSEAIWHVRGPSWDTRTGMSAIHQAREAIGLSMAIEDSHAKLHANGAQPSGLYSVDGSLSPDQYKSLSDWVMKQISGENRSKPLILDRGAKWTPSAMTGVDSQALETRKHQIEEICRAFRTLPLMIGHSDKTQTFASAEQMFLAHVVHTLMPWYERIEQSADVNLLTEQDYKDGVYVKHVPNGLMRGASKDRAEYYMKRWQMGTLNANEIRELEDENPYLGGEIYRVQLNTTDASKAIDETPPPPQ